MTPHIDAGVASGTLNFAPAAWLKSLTSIGGDYALTSGRHLTLIVDHCDGEDPAIVIAHLLGRPDRQEAVKRTIERRQSGEA